MCILVLRTWLGVYANRVTRCVIAMCLFDPFICTSVVVVIVLNIASLRARVPVHTHVLLVALLLVFVCVWSFH